MSVKVVFSVRWIDFFKMIFFTCDVTVTYQHLILILAVCTVIKLCFEK